MIIITYNQKLYVREAIESAISQTYKNIELIICDDGSTDSTQEIIKEYSEKYPTRIKAILNKDNVGITGNCNRALKHVTGEFVSFQGGDDVLEINKVESQIECFSNDESMLLCYHDVAIFDDAGDKDLGLYSDRHPLRSGGIKELIEYGCFFCATSVMIKASSIPKSGFRDIIKYSSDYFFWCEVILSDSSQNSTIGYCEGVLARYRRHNSNITKRISNDVVEDLLVTFELIAEAIPSLKSLIYASKAKRLYIYLFLFIQAKDFKNFCKVLVLIIKQPRYVIKGVVCLFNEIRMLKYKIKRLS
jgi:glycosyltransferase involved in cell wall biosynthesis